MIKSMKKCMQINNSNNKISSSNNYITNLYLIMKKYQLELYFDYIKLPNSLGEWIELICKKVYFYYYNNDLKNCKESEIGKQYSKIYYMLYNDRKIKNNY